LPDGSVLIDVSPTLRLLQPPETTGRFAITAEVIDPERGIGLALPADFRYAGDFFTLAAQEPDGEAVADLPLPVVVTYRPSAAVLDRAANFDRLHLALVSDMALLPLPCTRGDGMLTCVASHAGLFAALIVPEPSPPLDAADTGGWLYRQANGLSGAGMGGYRVYDDAQASFWTELQRYGGVNTIGYPITQRFEYQGFVTQAFQKMVLQWRPELGQAVPVNVLDDLNARGTDAWLDRLRQVPPAADTAADTGLSWDEVVARHVALLDAYPALRAFYDATPGAMDLYGLPLSVKDYGTFVAVRLQRATLQLWPAAGGSQQVVVGNAADVAKEIGLWPLSAVVTQQPTSPNAASNVSNSA
jgi:hypothetical protein